MLLKHTVLFLVLVAVQSATLQGRNIPVEIRYERYDHDISSNLAEKVQLSPVQLKENQLRLEKLQLEDDSLFPTKDNTNSIRNLDEKVQLSPEELRQAPKHVPIHHSLKQVLGDIEKPGEFRSVPLQASPNTESSKKLIQQAQDIIEKGLENLKKNFVPKENEVAPPKELWDKLERDVKKYIAEQKNRLGSRQDPGATQPTIIQSFVNGFQQMTNNFVQQFQGQIQRPQNGTSSDEGTGQPQGPIQGFIGYFTGGVQNIVSNIQNLGQNGQQASGNSTVLGDAPTSQQPPNLIGSFVNGVQQFFQGPQQGISQVLSGNNTQGSEDETSSQPPPQNFIQNIGQNIGNAFQNLQNQFRPTQKPAEGGETSSSNPIIEQVSNIGTQIQQVAEQAASNNPFQNIIPGSSSENSAKNPPTEKPAAAQSDTTSEKVQPDGSKTEEPEKKEAMIATE